MQISEYNIVTETEKSLTVAVVADLHDNPYKELLKNIEKYDPDIIAVPGDLMNDPCHAKNALSFLKDVNAVAPVFYSIGNHEKINNENISLISKTGAVLLDNTFIKHTNITVGGLTSGFRERKMQGNLKTTPKPDTLWLKELEKEAGLKILLCHHPEYYKSYLSDFKIDIIISGHAHGGQWRIFNRGIFAPGQGIFPKYTCGVYDNRLVVSRGLANNSSIPRIFNDIELVILKVCRKKQF